MASGSLVHSICANMVWLFSSINVANSGAVWTATLKSTGFTVVSLVDILGTTFETVDGYL